jgi:hypothetical protein
MRLKQDRRRNQGDAFSGQVITVQQSLFTGIPLSIVFVEALYKNATIQSSHELPRGPNGLIMEAKYIFWREIAR